LTNFANAYIDNADEKNYLHNFIPLSFIMLLKKFYLISSISFLATVGESKC